MSQHKTSMFLDFLFQIWRRLSSNLQWWFFWLISSKFMVSVSGIVLDDAGRILLQRHRYWVQDVWGLPGGIVQSGETVEAAFAREVLEETHLAIVDIELIRVVSNYRLRLEIVFRATLADGAQAIQIQKQEVFEARFFPLHELPVNMLSLQKELIEKSTAALQETAGE